MELAAVILAAGKGTRMKSRRPKVLHKICGKPMLSHVLQAVREAGASRVVVVAGFGYEQVQAQVSDAAEVVHQAEQLGTGHALLQTERVLGDFAGDILVVCGDTPLLSGETLAGLARSHVRSGAQATVLTGMMPEPGGYGRIMRKDNGAIDRIVEQKDASPEELQVKEINTGVYCFKASGLFDALKGLTPSNAQGEYYLTDVIARYNQAGLMVAAQLTGNPAEVQGVNDRRQLAAAEGYMRRLILDRLMLDGVSVVDPLNTYVEAGVKIGQDTVIYPYSFITGNTVIGTECILGPGAQVVNSHLGDGVELKNSLVMDSQIGDYSTVGPYAYLRPGTVIGRKAKVGDFVEIKKSVIGDGSKVPHLSYIGDATVGTGVNIGAGTITCNYDGEKKWPSLIGDNAFIGSNTNLVAPVNVGPGAVVAAGSTITRDVPAGSLGVARNRQANIDGWVNKKGKKRD